MAEASADAYRVAPLSSSSSTRVLRAYCWAEVYDKDPREFPQTAMRINAGFISDAGSHEHSNPDSVVDQLDALLPLAEW